jgi:8-amino-7-oxononanoate synthase
MADLDAILTGRLVALEAKGQRRRLRAGERARGVAIERGGRRFLSFSCNDYLGLSWHPEVIRASAEATQRYGAGAGASRLVTGEHPLYGELESLLARAKGTEAACVFGSGYLANLGTIPALVGADDLIVADKLVHACMLDGARLSGAKLVRFAHNDAGHCESILRAQRGSHRHCLLMTETVFSMDGDRAPVGALAGVARAHGAWLMTDDAHGFGVVESEAHGDVQMGTLSKAAGGYGGYVCGSAALVDLLKTSARSVMFSTGLPAGVLAGAIAAIGLIERSPELRALPLARARQFTGALGLAAAQSAIVPMIIGGNEAAVEASGKLEARGFLVGAIRPPTVPEGTARLRFTFSAAHAAEQVESLVAAVRECGLCAR